MERRSAPSLPPASSPPPEPDDLLEPGPDAVEPPTGPDLSGLPVAGITRRRVAFLMAAFVTAWIVIAFARQVGESSAASARLRDVSAANAQLRDRVASLQREYVLIQKQQYIAQQARAFGLGADREIPFSMPAGAPPLAADAPGSAAVRLGASTDSETPLESWLSVLFGPSR